MRRLPQKGIGLNGQVRAIIECTEGTAFLLDRIVRLVRTDDQTKRLSGFEKYRTGRTVVFHARVPTASTNFLRQCQSCKGNVNTGIASPPRNPPPCHDRSPRPPKTAKATWPTPNTLEEKSNSTRSQPATSPSISPDGTLSSSSKSSKNASRRSYMPPPAPPSPPPGAPSYPPAPPSFCTEHVLSASVRVSLHAANRRCWPGSRGGCPAAAALTSPCAAHTTMWSHRRTSTFFFVCHRHSSPRSSEDLGREGGGQIDPCSSRRHVMSDHVTPCRVISCRTMSCHVISHHVMSCHFTSCQITSRHLMSCDVMGYGVIQ